MKRSLGMFVVFMLGIPCITLNATFIFGSRDSSLNISSGARFNNSSNNLTIDGTLKQESGADISGSPMTFNDGVLDSSGLEAVMQGVFDPVGADSVRLEGSGRFRAEPGTLIHALTVQGSNNTIEGQPLFNSSIVLVDSSTDLTLALQNRLNQNVNLNDGTVNLGDDLGLADDVVFKGPGRINLNDRQLRLGGHYAEPWGNNLIFQNAADIVLDCNLSLTGIWTFNGTSCLCGNGVLDLSDGGQIIIDNDSLLTVNNLFITGLSDEVGKGKIIFNNAGSILKTANATFKLDGDVTNNQGTLYVCGPTTFQIGDKDWTFNTNANLTVDGTTLWLDPLDAPCFTGVINAPFPLFTPVGWSHANLLADLASGNLSLINRGTIKEVVDSHQIDFDLSECMLLDGVEGEVDLYKCICLGSGERINVIGNACINGNGVEVEFTDQLYSQFIVREGVTVLLHDIKFVNVHANTMDLRDNSAIQIGENVIWELSSDMTFSANATIQVVDGNNGCSVTTGGTNVFTIRGQHCRQAFNIQPLDDQLTNGRPRQTFDLGHNTIMLEQAQISGFDHISFFNDDISAAAVALSCNAAADINSNFSNIRGEFGTAMNFFIEGASNDIILRRDGMFLSGNISFGDLPDNQVRLNFNLAQLLDPTTTPGRNGVLPDFPFVFLDGDPGVFMFSAEGLAEFEFADFNATIRNRTSNSFVIDENSLLLFKRLQILDNPIKQQSTLFRFEGIELFNLPIDPGFIRSPRKHNKSILITAIHIKRQMEKEALAEAHQKAKEKIATAGHAPFKPSVRPQKPIKHSHNKPGKQQRSLLDELITKEVVQALAQEEIEEADLYRALNLPVSFDQVFVDQIVNRTAPMLGNISYNRVQLNNFTVDPELPFNILIQNETVVTLGANTVLNEGHVINVRGPGNVIRLPYNMTIGQDNILLEQGAELTFEFSDQFEIPRQLTITAGTSIDIEPNAQLRFSGPGVALMSQGSELNFKGVKKFHPTTKVETILSRGYLEIVDSAALSVIAQGSARMWGVGQIDISLDGAILLNGANSTLIFGSDSSTVGSAPSELFYDMVLNVYDNGRVQIEPTSGFARVSFRHISSDIRFKNDGLLFVKDGGSFEINTSDSTPYPSRLKKLSFRSGNVFVNGTGRLFIASNRINFGTGQEYPFSYDGLLASVNGTGLVRYENTTGGSVISGTLNPAAAVFTEISQLSAQQLVSSLISQ